MQLDSPRDTKTRTPAIEQGPDRASDEAVISGHVRLGWQLAWPQLPPRLRRLPVIAITLIAAASAALIAVASAILARHIAQRVVHLRGTQATQLPEQTTDSYHGSRLLQR